MSTATVDMVNLICDRILVKSRKAEELSPGGIIIPPQAQEKQCWGEVVAIGPGLWCQNEPGRYPMQVKVGDLVAFGKYTGEEIEIAGQEYSVMREGELLAIVPKEE